MTNLNVFMYDNLPCLGIVSKICHSRLRHLIRPDTFTPDQPISAKIDSHGFRYREPSGVVANLGGHEMSRDIKKGDGIKSDQQN